MNECSKPIYQEWQDPLTALIILSQVPSYHVAQYISFLDQSVSLVRGESWTEGTILIICGSPQDISCSKLERAGELVI